MKLWKINLKRKKEYSVTLPLVTKAGVIETAVKTSDPYLYRKLLRAREIAEKSGLPIDGFVNVKVRRWVRDDNGPIIAQNGERGYYGEWKNHDDVPNLLTNGGRDDFIDKCYIHNGVGTAAGNFIGISSDTGAPAATDTSLTGEKTTNGLSRAQATTRTHTTGSNDWSLQITFTDTTAQTLALQKAGLFTVTGPPVAGVMSHESTFTSVDLQVNDQLQLTWSGTLG